MKITSHRRRTKCVWFAAAILAFFFISTSSVWTQVAPPGVLVGPTLAASLRNAAAATKDQALAVQSTAQNWARRANTAHYRAENLEADIRTMYLQFHGLRERFNWMGGLALESKKPNAGNALAELDAGLNIIEELLVFLNQQFTAGSLDQATVARTTGTLADVMGQWGQELKRSNSRMGLF
jgi:glucose-6-phosphate isomerase